MKRRTLLKSLAVVGVCDLSLAYAETKPKHMSGQPAFPVLATDTLLAQSGIFGHSVCVIGALRCAKPEEMQRNFTKIRAETSFNCDLSFRSRNKYKVPYFNALVADWVKSGRFRIYLRILNAHAEGKRTTDNSISSYAGEITSVLSMGGGIAQNDGRVVTQSRFKGSEEKDFESLILSRNSRAKSIEKIAPRRCDAFQFLSTILGVIHADLVEGKLKPSNAAKSECTASFKTALGISSFDKAVTKPTLQTVLVS